MLMKASIKKILTLKQLRSFISNTTVIRRFADNHNMVYFGSVDRDDDGSRLVKGITMSNTYNDGHYSVGSDYARDMVFVQRADRIRSAMNRKFEAYTWNILALDLKPTLRHPHIYIEGRARHGRGFYEMLAMKYRELVEIPVGFLPGYDPLFMKRFCVRLSAATAVELPGIITPDRAAVMAHHFHMLDFEIKDDVLYVYLMSFRPTMGQLEHMVKAGVWLANEIDGRNVPAESAEPESESHNALY